ncbi:MAG: AmmeMemoRadiSam system protein B [Thermodesulfovibrionales bacterium]|nr:AmmeMemoRadiSam system protein B [Thermodesulfovibrionales bacterium]
MSTLKTTRIFVFLLVTLIVTPLTTGCAEQVKEPSVAGQFYPSDKKALGEMVNGFIGNSPQGKGEGKIIALISPHAGYVYSGQVAAYGYRQIQGHEVKNVILIGVSHRSAFKGASVYTKGRFKSPFGEVRINEPLAQSFLNETAEVKYLPEAFEREHSIEVQLPFLQTVLKDFMIIPILIGTPTQKTFDHLISRISDTFDEKTLIVASTDLSHYHDYHKAIGMDSKIISAVERLSTIQAGQLLQNGEAEMCGAFAVIITMEAAKRLGATQGVLFRYANSGDVTGEKDKVVGYASLGLFRSPYTEVEKKELLSLAKNAIAEHVTNGKTPDKEISNPKLRADGAVFVTIKKNGSLRGCIGNIQAVMPLYESVIKNAIAASSSDPRFPPLTQEEIKDIEVEISILSPLSPLRDVKDIQVGRHGLFIRKGIQRGLLLPQVATEYGWDRETFLDQLCVKAGLPKGAWQDAELYRFTAEIIR